MKTRVYPTSRKLFGLLGDVTIITLTYLVLTYLLVNPAAVEAHHVLYSGMLPVAVIFTVIWIRWTFPRTTFYGLLNLSWKVLIPIALANLILTSALLKVL